MWLCVSEGEKEIEERERGWKLNLKPYIGRNLLSSVTCDWSSSRSPAWQITNSACPISFLLQIITAVIYLVLIKSKTGNSQLPLQSYTGGKIVVLLKLSSHYHHFITSTQGSIFVSFYPDCFSVLCGTYAISIVGKVCGREPAATPIFALNKCSSSTLITRAGKASISLFFIVI